MKHTPPTEDHPAQLYLFDPGQPVQVPATESEILEWIETLIDRVMRSRHKGKAPRIMDYDWESFRQQVYIGAANRVVGKFIHGWVSPSRAKRGLPAMKIWTFVGGAIFYSLRDVQKMSIAKNRKHEASGVQDAPILDYIDTVA